MPKELSKLDQFCHHSNRNRIIDEQFNFNRFYLIFFSREAEMARSKR
jgi:hypothetical protein